ncbi:MAG: pantoate kinase [Candidatus Hodarchaeales archaeon]
MKEARVFIPGHATCFFSPQFTDDPLTTGSLGAGFCTKLGTLVTLKSRPNSCNTIRAYFASSLRNLAPELVDAHVSRTAAELYLERSEIVAFVELHMDLDFPVGIGLGASACGALGTVMSLNEVYGTLDTTELYQLAHIAEIVHRTGLGDVIAQISGGFETRVAAGAPGLGEVIRHDDISTDVLIMNHGPMSTSPILKSQSFQSVAESLGKQLLRQFLLEPSASQAAKLGRVFAEKTGLLTEAVRESLECAAKSGYPNGSMVLIGNSTFLFVDDSEIAAKILKLDKRLYYKTAISRSGASIL